MRWAPVLSLLVALGCTQDFDKFTIGGGVGGDGGEGGVAGEGGGGDGGGGAAPCEMPLTPPGGDCPDICDSCTADTCTILCDRASECFLRDIQCPPGFACDVVCSSTSACLAATVACPAEYDCSVSCVSANACPQLELGCGQGRCSINCTSNACRDTTVTCGANACDATCTDATQEPALDCGPSCACTPC